MPTIRKRRRDGVVQRYHLKKRTPSRTPKERAIWRIQHEINTLLFHPRRGQTDRELLTITVLRSKEKYFQFLEGYTAGMAIGRWKTFKNEKNVVIEIEFRDTSSELVGKKLIILFNKYNRLVVKEKLLYVRTEAIEESSL